MHRIVPRDIKKQAVSALADQQTDYRRLVFLHAAVSTGFLLIISLIGLVIDRSLVNTQGLDGIGKAGMLKSIYTVCMLAGNLLLPFWQAGITYTSVRVARRQNAAFPMLTRGFHRFVSLAGYYFLLILLLFAAAMFCFYAVATPFICVPLPKELSAAIQSLDLTDAAQIIAFQEEYFLEILLFSIPFIILYICVFGVVAIALNYRFFMCSYLLLEDERPGALAVFGMSSRMTKGERKNLFLLDLSFWWYHFLTALISLIVYVPDILLAAGVILPASYETASFLTYLGYMVCYLILTGLAGAYYQTSLACAYEMLKQKNEE